MQVSIKCKCANVLWGVFDVDSTVDTSRRFLQNFVR
jgi:hypothetical protein